MTNATVDQLLRLALQHHQGGRLALAEGLYRQILAREPDHAAALHYLGLIAAQVGQPDAALDLITRAVALKPDYAEAYSNLGNVLKEKGRLDEAIAAHRRAVALRPNWAEGYSNLGVALQAGGSLDEAIAAYRRAIALKPQWVEVHANLCAVLRDAGKLDESIAMGRAAIAINPSYADACNNLGSALKDAGQVDEAIAAYRRAIGLKSNYAEAYSNLGNALTEKGDLDQALAACRTAISLNPNLSKACNNLGNALKDQGQLDQAIAAYRQAVALDPIAPGAASNLLYILHFHPAYDAGSIAGEHHRWNQAHAEPLKKYIPSPGNDRNPDRRLRIGYVSPDFREHPVGRFILPLLTHHDRGQFELFAYAHVAAPDAMTQRLRSSVDQWRNIAGLSDSQAAEMIRLDRIDILVDLTMHMARNRLLIFARKPAPVQVTYLAYCSTTGLETIDYRLSDPYLDPPGEDESIYSEKTIRLPETYWCYQPGNLLPEAGPLPALRQGWITFGCLNNFCKVNEAVLAAWAKILRAVPRSQLLLHAHEGSHRQRLLDRLQREGIEPERVQFVGFMPPEKYFELYCRIDVALDTFPYGGGTTTCDALWMGAAVVSLAGKTAVGRAGVSILSNVALSELLAHSEEEYVRIATDLAGDLPRLSELRQSLRRRMEASPLKDAPRFARHFEGAYRQIWRQWCAAPSQR